MVEGESEKFPERIDPLNEGANPEGMSRNLLRTHLERYNLAKRHVRGAVLDAACGFGYGSSVMAENPLVDKVVGMDLSGDTVRYAVEHYIGQKPRNAGRVSFVTGDCENLGWIFGRGAFDNVVSFETIEHLNHPERFLEGVRQVLRGGVLMVSTPLGENSRTDGDGRPVNPYHVREFTYGK